MKSIVSSPFHPVSESGKPQVAEGSSDVKSVDGMTIQMKATFQHRFSVSFSNSLKKLVWVVMATSFGMFFGS